MDRIAEGHFRKESTDGMLCELEVSVCTGFEMMAKEEIEETISSASNITVARGRVNMLVPIDHAKKVRYFCNLLYSVLACVTDMRSHICICLLDNSWTLLHRPTGISWSNLLYA